MSFLFADPDGLAAAAANLTDIGSTIDDARAAAAGLTSELIPAAQDEVSDAIARVFGTFARDFQSLNTQAAAFHNRLVSALSAGTASYAAAEGANVSGLLQTAEQNLLGAVNAPAEALLGHSLFGTGTGGAMAAGTGGAGSGLAQLLAQAQQEVSVTLVMGGSGMPLPTQEFINAVNNAFINPILQGPVKGIFTPEQFYPFSGPNALTLSQSVSLGLADLHSDLYPLVQNWTPGQLPVGVFGYSQSAVIASLEMMKLQALGVPSDAVHFVLIGDLMNPNGGLFSRFAGLNLSQLGIDFYGSTPSNAYPTTIFTREYDSWADVPQYPLNIFSDLNTLFSSTHFSYPNLTPQQVASAIQLPTSGPTQTTYYMIPTNDLPLVDPLRMIPILGNPIADLLQPDLTYLVNLGYGNPLYGWSTGPANVPTGVGILPPLSAFGQLPGLLAGGTVHGIENFVGDFTGTGPHPVTLPSFNSLGSLVSPSAGAMMGATGGMSNPLAALSSVVSDPSTLGSALANLPNSLSNSASSIFDAIRPTADILYAGLVNVPAYDVNLFLSNLNDPIKAITLPLVSDIFLYMWLGNFESAVI